MVPITTTMYDGRFTTDVLRYFLRTVNLIGIGVDWERRDLGFIGL
jgi:hypothetical protein